MVSTEYLPSRLLLQHSITFGSALVQALYLSIIISLGTTASCDCYSIPSVIVPWSDLSTAEHAGLCWIVSVLHDYRLIYIDIFPWSSLVLLMHAGNKLFHTPLDYTSRWLDVFQNRHYLLCNQLCVHLQYLILQLLYHCCNHQLTKF